MRLFAFQNTLVKRRVVVNLKTGRALEGILYAKRGPLYVLRNATLHDEGRQLNMDGEAVIERQDVEWVQVLS
jgi:hypothetical protein